MNAVDTNILIYARDPRDPVKQQAADTLLASLTDGVLLWQVACAYLAASRKLKPLGYDQAQAWADVRDMRRTWITVLPSWSVMDRAETLLASYNLSFWDAMIVAACLENGIKRLYSEDFDSSAAATGLDIVNPFVA